MNYNKTLMRALFQHLADKGHDLRRLRVRQVVDPNTFQIMLQINVPLALVQPTLTITKSR